ncbi:MAG: OmpA family protein [Pseudonocardiaceae bacterium]
MTDKNTRSAELDSLAQELTVARATDLARSGHYAQAEQLLAPPARDTPMSAAELDLLARIHAQQGRLAEADDYWARAAQTSRDSGAYRSQRQRIATLQQQRFRTSRGLRWAGLGLLTVAVVVAVLTWLPRDSGDGGRSDPPTEQVQRRADQVLADIGRREQEAQGLLSAIRTESSSPATLIRQTPGSLSVSFTLPLFQGGSDDLTPQGRAALGDLGRRLAPHAAQISVSVLGHTEDAVVASARYRNNAELGLGRALAARERLSAASGIPLQGFAMSSAGRDTTQFPSDNHTLNRTVTLTITPLPG